MKNSSITEIIVPRYQELSVEQIWPMIKDFDDIAIYFPDYTEKHKPDRDYMYSILSTLRYDELKKVIVNAR